MKKTQSQIALLALTFFYVFLADARVFTLYVQTNSSKGSGGKGTSAGSGNNPPLKEEKPSEIPAPEQEETSDASHNPPPEEDQDSSLAGVMGMILNSSVECQPTNLRKCSLRPVL